MLNRSKYILSSFHILIIAIFLFSLSACGYKAPPRYTVEAPQGDENVEFILNDKKVLKDENNESCQ